MISTRDGLILANKYDQLMSLSLYIIGELEKVKPEKGYNVIRQYIKSENFILAQQRIDKIKTSTD